MDIYKSMNHLNPSIVWEFHEKKRTTYNLRIKNLCKLPTIKTLGFGLNSLSFRCSFLCNTLDDSIKQVPTLSRFKKGSKTGQQIDAPVKYVADYKYYFFYFVYIMFVNSLFELVLSQYYCKYQL